MTLNEAKHYAKLESELSLHVFVVYREWNNENFSYATEEEYVETANEISVLSLARFEDGQEIY